MTHHNLEKMEQYMVQSKTVHWSDETIKIDCEIGGNEVKWTDAAWKTRLTGPKQVLCYCKWKQRPLYFSQVQSERQKTMNLVLIWIEKYHTISYHKKLEGL